MIWSAMPFAVSQASPLQSTGQRKVPRGQKTCLQRLIGVLRLLHVLDLLPDLLVRTFGRIPDLVGRQHRRRDGRRDAAHDRRRAVGPRLAAAQGRPSLGLVHQGVERVVVVPRQHAIGDAFARAAIGREDDLAVHHAVLPEEGAVAVELRDHVPGVRVGHARDELAGVEQSGGIELRGLAVGGALVEREGDQRGAEDAGLDDGLGEAVQVERLVPDQLLLLVGARRLRIQEDADVGPVGLPKLRSSSLVSPRASCRTMSPLRGV